jgi:hypothetical protein
LAVTWIPAFSWVSTVSYFYPILDEPSTDERITVPEDEPHVPVYDLKTGEIAATENKFVSLKALEKFTHKYVEGANRNKVGSTSAIYHIT